MGVVTKHMLWESNRKVLRQEGFISACVGSPCHPSATTPAKVTSPSTWVPKIATNTGCAHALAFSTEHQDWQRPLLRSHSMVTGSHWLRAKIWNHCSGSWECTIAPPVSHSLFLLFGACPAAISDRAPFLHSQRTSSSNALGDNIETSLYNRWHCLVPICPGFESSCSQVLCAYACCRVITTAIPWRFSVSNAGGTFIKQKEKLKFQLLVHRAGSLRK